MLRAAACVLDMGHTTSSVMSIYEGAVYAAPVRRDPFGIGDLKVGVEESVKLIARLPDGHEFEVS